MQDEINGENTDHGSPGERVLQFIERMRTLVERGKRDSNVTPADWNVLADLVETADFERIGPFHDAMNWDAYIAMLCGWVNATEGWEPVLKSLSEASDRVFAQCEEMITENGAVFPFYSLSMYEFNAAGKIHRIHVYMQQPQTVEES